MKYEPKKNSKKAEAVAMVLFFAAIVTTLLANVMEKMQWVPQVVTIGLLGLFIYILVRYSFTDYMFEIRPKSKMETDRFEDIPAERLQLSVQKKQSRRGYAADFICEVGEIRSIEPVKAGEKKKGKKFFYYRNISGATKYLLTVENSPEPILLYLEINDDGKDFLSFLQKKISR